MIRAVFGAVRGTVCAAVLVVAAAAQSEPKWTESEVALGTGDAALHASYIAPGAWKAEFDAVLILPGSGPTDRNGNQAGMQNDSLKMIALALGEEGIASLRMDKRGVAASIPAMTTAPREQRKGRGAQAPRPSRVLRTSDQDLI